MFNFYTALASTKLDDKFVVFQCIFLFLQSIILAKRKVKIIVHCTQVQYNLQYTSMHTLLHEESMDPINFQGQAHKYKFGINFVLLYKTGSFSLGENFAKMLARHFTWR